MANILTNPAETAAAVEENAFDLFRAMAAHLPSSQLIETDHLSHHLTPPGNPMFKGVWRTHLTAENADAVIEHTLDWFKSQDVPFLFWWTSPRSTPADIGERLIAHGLIGY